MLLFPHIITKCVARVKNSQPFLIYYNMSIRLFAKNNNNNNLESSSITVSGADEVVSEAETKKSKKENKSLISSTKKEKKKSKEKETRYAHLGDESSGEEDVDGK